MGSESYWHGAWKRSEARVRAACGSAAGLQFLLSDQCSYGDTDRLVHIADILDELLDGLECPMSDKGKTVVSARFRKAGDR
jgi:hypothetical protein